MTDLHEGILSLFAEGQRRAPFRPSDPFGRAWVALIPGSHRARKTTRTRLVQCTQCGRKGHYAPQCTYYEDWYDPPPWLVAQPQKLT